MAQCKETAREFIQDVFSPMVAVLCSSDVETVCQKNGLTFVELIQPFCRLTSEAHIRDSNNVSHTIRNLHIIVHDMNTHPPQNVLARKLLNDVVSSSLPQHCTDIMLSNVVTVSNHDLQLDATTPWFEAYRSAFLQIAYPSDHEFLRHYLACIFVVSSSNSDPIEQFVKLTQQQSIQQHQQPHKLPKWFMPNILRYYVLLHDVTEEDEVKVESIYQTLKTKYGVQLCHLLHINSRSPMTSTSDSGSTDLVNMPNPWSRYVTHKQEISEAAEFESFLGPGEEELDEFPSHVTEGSLHPTSSDIDLAMEATEDDRPSHSINTVIDHPLVPDNTVVYDPLTTVDSFDTSSQLSSNHTTIKVVGPTVQVNQNSSKSNRSTIQLGACLTLSDHDRLRIFINEFIVRGLISWAEKTVRTLNEQLTTRKGLHRSFFSATKKWFGGNKPTNPAVITNSTNVVYTPDAPEMQMRRLADLSFMFQLYELSYQIYHSAKKDFNNDHAWLHYAGAMEMACLSIFMQETNSQRQYPLHYMETTITTYLAACKVPHFATRATLLSTEVLKSKGLYAEAAMQFIKMTSEESDLRSSLLLEQAAHCFIKMKTPMVRKYAFHMILAGHRFNKSGQKRHALRSYAQALQVYKSRYWKMAEDHINYTIGCQSFNLKQFDIATSAFKHLLSTNSEQSLTQQTAFLREYLSVFKLLASQSSPDDETRELPELPLPIVHLNNTKILCVAEPILQTTTGLRIAASGVSFDTTDAENCRFSKLEELFFLNPSSISFKPTIQCFTKTTNNSSCPVVVVEEPVIVEVMIINPLKVALLLRDVRLLWRFIPNVESNSHRKLYSSEMDINSYDGVIDCSTLTEIILEGNETKMIHLSMTIHIAGEMQITGLAIAIGCMTAVNQLLTGTTSAVQGNMSLSSTGYHALSSLPLNGTNTLTASAQVLVSGKVNLEVYGPRLNGTKEERMSKVYGPDRRLSLVVIDKMPKLEVFFHNFPSSLLAGQLCQVTVELVNTGQRSLHNIRLVSSNPEFFTCATSNEPDSKNKPLEDLKSLVCNEDVTFVTNLAIKSPMEPASSEMLTMWIRGPDVPGDHVIDFLFCYESVDVIPHLRHRVVRHTAYLTVHQSLVIRTICHRVMNHVTNHQETADASSSNNTIAVSVEVENSCSTQDICFISVLQASCISQDWNVHEINSLGSMKNVQIKNQECQLFTVSGNRNADCLTRDLKFSRVSFTSTQLTIAQSISTDFYFRSRLIDPLKTGQFSSGQPSVSDVSGLWSNTSAADHSFLKKLEKAMNVDLNLIIEWQASRTDGCGNSELLFGQHHMTIDMLNSIVTTPPVAKLLSDLPPIKFSSLSQVAIASLEPSTDSLMHLVRFTFQYQPHVTHDFQRNRVCVVPVVLNLYNSSDVQVCIDIDTLAGHEKSTPGSHQHRIQAYNSLYQGHSTRSFTWSSTTSTRLYLSPDSCDLIQLKACFISPGVYDLSIAQVYAFPVLNTHQSSALSIQPTIQRPMSSSLIIIHNKTDEQKLH